MFLAIAGCGDSADDNTTPTIATVEAMLPHLPHVAQTVGQYAVLDGGLYVPVQGYGLVINLGTNGGREIPDHLRDYMTTYLAKQGVGAATKGMGALSPMRMLQDPDTAIVLMGGAMPFGSPAGHRFDINITALPNTQARSLQGGYLLPSELRFSWMGQAIPGGPTKPLAMVSGPVFVNPFVDPTDEKDLVKWREGRIIGGAKVISNQTVRLMLRKPDYARADQIRRRINDTFASVKPVADAKSNSIIEINIPPQWRHDYEHFLGLVTHISLVSGSRWERHALDVLDAMELPDASHNDLSLILEAMGRKVIPMLRTRYASKNPMVAFYAARAGARLKDDMSAEVLIRLAQTSSSLQVQAIEEIGRNFHLIVPPDMLKNLLDDESSSVRIAAYEAMLIRGDISIVRRCKIDEDIALDIVNSEHSNIIYATQSGTAKIVLFGRDLEIATPIFFRSLGELVTIQAREEQPELSIFRKLPDGRFSDIATCDTKVESLIKVLASRPEANPDGGIHFNMGLTYGQVLAVLYRMCENNDIKAKFVLQPPPDEMKIYRGEIIEGRPDAPGM